jgi:hypothetical protein
MGTARNNLSQPLIATYDHPVDVLVITLGKAVPVEGEGRPGGIELDFALDSETPCAIKVIGFHRNGWGKMTDRLSGIAADHLDVSITAVKQAIDGAISNG